MAGAVNGSDYDFGAGSSQQSCPLMSKSRFNDVMEEFRRKIEAEAISEHFEECLELCTEALHVSPSSKEFMLLKAKFFVLTGQSDAANEILGDIFKDNPQNAEAISILGLIFYHQGNLKKSVEVFDNALQLNPQLIQAKLIKADAKKFIEVLEKIPNESTPKEKFTTSVTRTIADGLLIDPTNKEVMKTLRYHKGVASFKREEFTNAVDDFTDALKFDQKNCSLFMFRAKSYMSLEFYDDAIIDFLEVEKFNECEKISAEVKDVRRKIGKLFIPKSNYDFLEIPRTASDQEIVRSFTSLKLLHKVNLSKASTDAEKRKIIFKFKRVENAFAILSDKKLKKKHDKQLAGEEAQLESAMRRQECYEGCSGCVGKCCAGFGCCLGSCGKEIRNCCKQREMKIALMVIAGITLVIGLAYFMWWLMGLWVIIPGFFMTLCSCFYCCYKLDR